MTFLKRLFHFLIAVLVCFLIASIAHSQFVVQALIDVGVDVALADRVSMTISDLWGLLPGYGAIIAAAFLVGFLIINGINHYLFPVPYAYGVAGGLAIIVALLAMHPIFNVTLIAGARSDLGFASQVVAGIVGGLVYQQLRTKNTR